MDSAGPTGGGASPADTLPPMPEVLAVLRSTDDAAKRKMHLAIRDQCLPALRRRARKYLAGFPDLQEQAALEAFGVGLIRMERGRPPSGPSVSQFLVACLKLHALHLASVRTSEWHWEPPASSAKIDAGAPAGGRRDPMDENPDDEPRRGPEDGWTHLAESFGPLAPDTEQTTAERRQLEDAWAAIETLPPRQREVMKRHLAYQDDETIASELGISPATVRRNLAEARDKLRRACGSEGR